MTLHLLFRSSRLRTAAPAMIAAGWVAAGWIAAAVVLAGAPRAAMAENPTTRPAAPKPAASTTKPLDHAPAAPAEAPLVGTPSTRPASDPIFRAPNDEADLREIEREVRDVMKKAAPATVGVIMGGGQGSGVIVSKSGYVLTAGHVAREPNQNVMLVLSDGRRVRGKTLGINEGIDSGLIKITADAGDKGWPYVETGSSADLKTGEWVVALGHPGGYRRDRPPVLRIGRVLSSNDSLITTDCTLVGGDSGGPLFDLDGRVIGIHSRIGGPVTANIHVPIDTYTSTWERLARGETWGQRFAFGGRGALLGVQAENDLKGCKVTSVTADGPADKAGVREGDIIAELNGKPVDGYQGLVMLLARQRPGEQITLELLRGDETMSLKVTLGRRPRNS